MCYALYYCLIYLSWFYKNISNFLNDYYHSHFPNEKSSYKDIKLKKIKYNQPSMEKRFKPKLTVSEAHVLQVSAT